MSAVANLLGAVPRYVALQRSQHWPPETLHAYTSQGFLPSAQCQRWIPR